MTTTKQAPAITFRDVGLEAQLDMRTEPGQSRSLTAKEHLTRYFRIMAYEAGSCGLDAREWVALKVATLTRVFRADEPTMLHASVYDAFQAGELSDDWDDFSVLQFMDKLNALSQAKQWAVVDMLERWRITGD